MLEDLKVSVQHFAGSPRQVADLARTTIGLEDGDKVVSEKYMRKMYLCEHSPIRAEMYLITFENIPYWVAMHFCRHKIGVEHFVSTQRDDRQIDVDVPRDKKGQGEPVRYRMLLNAQAFITISRKRCCTSASPETRYSWERALSELEKIDKVLSECCVADCIYRGWCYEHKSCNYHKSRGFRQRLNEYRNNINGYGGE